MGDATDTPPITDAQAAFRLLDEETQGALKAAHASAKERFPNLSLAFDIYAGDVIALSQMARETLGLGGDGLGDSIRARALEDLYLARACEHGSEKAWATLVGDYQLRLTGLARARGGRGAAAEQEASALIADLALPPPGGRTRHTPRYLPRTGVPVGLAGLDPRSSPRQARQAGQARIGRRRPDAGARRTPTARLAGRHRR